MTRQTPAVRRALVAAISLAACAGAFAKVKTSDPQKARSDYIARIEQQVAAAPSHLPPGSLWLPDGLMTDLAADYKARRLNDLVTIVVVQQTTAQMTGDVSTERDFNTTSGITGLGGHITTSGVSNLLTAASSTTLKGTGATDAGSTLTTSLAGRVIALLSNGNMVVEAARQIQVNSQKETMVVRGVLRPGDVGPDNTAPSTALSDLEIELKGKGVITDALRPPNRIVRALLWLIGF